MKQLLVTLFACLILGCGSSNNNDFVVDSSGGSNPPAGAPLDSETISLFALAIQDIFARPTGATLPNAVRFTDIVSPLFSFNESGTGPNGGTVTVSYEMNLRKVVFEEYKTSADALIDGTVLVDGSTQTFQNLRFLNAAGKDVQVNGTIHITFDIEGPITNLVVTSNISNFFPQDNSTLTLTNHVSKKKLDSTDPSNVIITFDDTAQIRIQRGAVDYHAQQTMPVPLVSHSTGPQSGEVLLTGIAPSPESIRLKVIEAGKTEFYLQKTPGEPFILVATI